MAKNAIAVALLCLLAGCASNRSRVGLTDLPAPVLSTIELQASAGSVDSIEKERGIHKNTYIAHTTIDGRHWDIAVAENGDLIYRHQQ